MDRKPGRPRGLSVEMIAQAALDDGLSDFSMPSVARRLGVAHSGLYRYVADREELLIKALDRAVLTQSWPSPDLEWQDLLRAIGEATWKLCDAYPGLDRATLAVPKSPRAIEDTVEAWIASIHHQGFLLEDAAVAVEFVFTLALSSSAEMARLRIVQSRRENGAPAPEIKAYENEEIWRGRGWYARKLDIVLAGLAQRHIEP